MKEIPVFGVTALNPFDWARCPMKTLVLGPDAVREALDPRRYPKRHVFLVSVDGAIICCDVDAGWITFQRPTGLTHKEWCVAIKAAISSMQHHLLVAKSIHDDIRDSTDRGVVPPVGECPECGGPSDVESAPYCSEFHRRCSRL
jgi:hypothetical protein